MRASVLATCLAVMAMAGWARAEEATKKADPVGSDTCLGCHSGQETYKKNVHAKGLVNAKGMSFDKQCEACHGNGSLHAGAGGDKNNPDFWTIKNPAKQSGGESSKGCIECHGGGKRIHWGGSAHDMKGVACAGCHSMHKPEINGGKSPLLNAVNELETCYKCHAEKKAQIRKSAHMPLVEGKMGCASCHNPHGSTDEKLLTKNSVMETCYSCHQDKRGPFLWEHAPARENCINCHNAHGGHNDKMLVTKIPLLCQRCHVGGRHPATFYDRTAVQISENSRAFGRGCIQCHPKIHGTNHPSGKYLDR